ncbi:hypothetical protein ALC62_00809 [Cyphomyrmex costatus]|uniref:Uncharacterized protein n=1 Tax=Cyphomyrmex costatus TaxID=456900 RepID=A0A151IPX1_9HYME|nr:hypothetical protein ALC62_00809 [Cyphomyrmex costatus]
MTHIPLVRDIAHENANETTRGTTGSHSRGPRQPRRRMPVSHEGIPTVRARLGPANERKKEKERERKRKQEMRSCKLDSMQMTARSRSRPLTLEIRCRICGAHVTKHLEETNTIRWLDYIVKAIFDAVVTGQSGLHPNKTIPVSDVHTNNGGMVDLDRMQRRYRHACFVYAPHCCITCLSSSRLVPQTQSRVPGAVCYALGITALISVREQSQCPWVH